MKLAPLFLGLLLAGCAAQPPAPAAQATQAADPATQFLTAYRLSKSLFAGFVPLMIRPPCPEAAIQRDPGAAWMQPPVPWPDVLATPHWEETWRVSGCGRSIRLVAGFAIEDVGAARAGAPKINVNAVRMTDE